MEPYSGIRDYAGGPRASPADSAIVESVIFLSVDPSRRQRRGDSVARLNRSSYKQRVFVRQLVVYSTQVLIVVGVRGNGNGGVVHDPGRGSTWHEAQQIRHQRVNTI